jgi:3-hydroxymyristoyl/3-hydroxydecanoyl-(acyl carrier protein) dehydratase
LNATRDRTRLVSEQVLLLETLGLFWWLGRCRRIGVRGLFGRCQRSLQAMFLPGDQVEFDLKMLKFRRNTCKMQGVARVGGETVAEAELLAAVVDR